MTVLGLLRRLRVVISLPTCLALVASSVAPFVVYASPSKSSTVAKMPLVSTNLPTIDTRNPIKVVPVKGGTAPKTVKQAVLPNFSPVASVKASDRAEWDKTARTSTDPAQKADALRLLGEYDLGRTQPQLAVTELEKALELAPKSSSTYAVATYDHAGALLLSGRLEAADFEFQKAEKLTLPETLLRVVHRLTVEAHAHSRYHASHAELGIPEPPELDPLCGAASLGAILKSYGMPHEKQVLSDATEHSGEGSTLEEVSQAAGKVGLYARPVRPTEEGLKVLGVPMVARVEHDHFVAILRATDKGVTYSCSDCGVWPGGKIFLNWEKWRAMDADSYLAVAPLGSEDAAVLAQLPVDGAVSPAIMASVRPSLDSVPVASRVARIGSAVMAQVGVSRADCGVRPACLACVMHGPRRVSAGNSDFHAPNDPYDPFTTEETWSPVTGLDVYNPHGPSFTFKPFYRSFDNPGPNGFGMSWSHAFNIRIISNIELYQPPTPPAENHAPDPYYRQLQIDGVLQPSYLELPNGETLQFHIPTTSRTLVGLAGSCVVDSAHRNFLVSFNGSGYDVTFQDRSVWTITGVIGQPYESCYLAKMTDAHGEYVTVNSTARIYSTPDQFFSGANQYRSGLQPTHDVDSISDQYGNTLLTLTHDSSTGLITTASDSHGRSIYYQYQRNTAPNGYITDSLTKISQVVSTGTSNPPIQYQLTYYMETWGDAYETISLPFLKTISVPSPTGTGLTTETVPSSNSGTVGPDPEGNYVFLDTSDTNTGPAYRDVYRYDVHNALMSKYTEVVDSHLSVTTVKNASGATMVTYTYGDANNVDRPTVINVGGSTTTLTYDQFGNVTRSVSPTGVITEYTYDYTSFGLGQLVTVKKGNLSPTSFTYNSAGDVLTIASPVPGNVGSTATQTTTFTYNVNGDILTVNAPGNSTVSAHTVTMTYATDANGPLVGQALTTTDSRGKVSSATYDAWGRMTSTTDENGHTSSVTYDIAGNVLTGLAPATGNTGSGQETVANFYLYVNGPITQQAVYNEAGTLVRTTSYTYGVEGELLSRTGEAENVSLTYDGAYRVSTLKDGNNNPTKYYYDANGWTSKITYPGYTTGSADSTTFSYNNIGQVVTRTDGRGNVTTFGYNSLLEPNSLSYASRPQDNVSLTYDNYGRPISMIDGVGSATAGYDDLGSVTYVTRQYSGIGSGSFNFSYSYYPDGSRATMVNPGGTTTYTYDANGRYTSMVSPAGTSSATYQDNGWQSSRTLPNGALTYYNYNNAGLLSGQQSQTSATGTVISKYYIGTGYDDAFNLKKLYPTVTGVSSFTGNTSFTYDTKDRLTQELSTKQGGYTSNFGYDAVGNPTTFKGVSRSYNSNNQFTRDTFDGNGNPTTYNGATLTFDGENRALSFGSVSTETYGADGLRASKTVGSATTYYLYDGGEPVVELNSSGTVTKVNVFAPDGLVASGKGSTWTQYLFDQQGSVSERLDSSQNISSHSTYDAYGVETSTSTPTDEFGFNARWGYIFDRESGLYLCQHRYYDPGTGRWVTRDPIGIGGGIALYSYSGSKPSRIDRSGYEYHDPVTLRVPYGFPGAVIAIGDSPGSDDEWAYLVPPGYETTPESIDVDYAVVKEFTVIPGKMKGFGPSTCDVGMDGSLSGDSMFWYPGYDLIAAPWVPPYYWKHFRGFKPLGEGIRKSPKKRVSPNFGPTPPPEKGHRDPETWNEPTGTGRLR